MDYSTTQRITHREELFDNLCSFPLFWCVRVELSFLQSEVLFWICACRTLIRAKWSPAAFNVYICILFCLKHTIWTFAPVYSTVWSDFNLQAPVYPTVWSDFNLHAPVYPTVHCIPVEYLYIYHLSKGCHNLSVTAYLVIVSIYLYIYIYWSDII